MWMPAESRGTRIIDCCRCFGALGSVLPMKINSLQRSSPAPEIHHLRPLTMKSSPSRTIDASMLVASEEATAGWVMAKAQRIDPSSNGSSHFRFCAGVPKRAKVSILPVSGAEQLNTCDDQ